MQNDIKSINNHIDSKNGPIQPMPFKDSSSESSSQEENSEKWVCPWKSKHQQVEISVFYSPSDFYVRASTNDDKYVIHFMYFLFHLFIPLNESTQEKKKLKTFS